MTIARSGYFYACRHGKKERKSASRERRIDDENNTSLLIADRRDIFARTDWQRPEIIDRRQARIADPLIRSIRESDREANANRHLHFPLHPIRR